MNGPAPSSIYGSTVAFTSKTKLANIDKIESGSIVIENDYIRVWSYSWRWSI